jgi:hypothetical protein
MSHENSLAQTIGFKHALVGELFEMEKAELKTLKQKWDAEDKAIREDWDPITRQIREEIEEFMLVCAFCGSAMTIDMLNNECLFNKNIDRKPSLTARAKF